MTSHPSRRKLAGHGDGWAGASHLQRPLASVDYANIRQGRRKLP
jgi:hypothetical protein